MITIKYTCNSCGILDRDVICPERQANEDVVAYLRETLAECVAADHSDHSPHCRAATMTNLKIPIDANNPKARIGEKPKPAS